MNALKTLPAALVAALGVIIAQGADTLPPWLLVILAGGLAAATVYATPPGPGLRTPKPGVHKGQGGYMGQGVTAIVVGIVAAVVGAILELGLLITIGVIVIVVGIVLLILNR